MINPETNPKPSGVTACVMADESETGARLGIRISRIWMHKNTSNHRVQKNGPRAGGGVSAERDREMTGWLTDTTYTLGGERLAPLTYLFRVTACNLCIKVAVSASHPSMR